MYKDFHVIYIDEYDIMYTYTIGQYIPNLKSIEPIFERLYDNLYIMYYKKSINTIYWLKLLGKKVHYM